MTGHEFYGNALVCLAIACGFVLVTLLAVTKPRTPPDGCEVSTYELDATSNQPPMMAIDAYDYEPELGPAPMLIPEDPEDSVAQPHRPVDTA